MTEKLITKSELADRLLMSERTIDNYRKLGLPTHWVAPVGIKPQPRFMISEVRAWITRERTRAIFAKKGMS